MKKYPLFLACSLFALPSAAYAQSSGSVEFEEEVIVVTGSAGPRDVGGVLVPDTPRARTVLTDELIQRQTPGQSINDIINLVPGVSFQNNDAFGSSGGTLTIRGFDSTRISQTFDGVPLNDSGNYAIYSNQQLDPELIEQVNVNLGTTDVDSPTASAVGGTVNYRTRLPREEFGAQVVASYGGYLADTPNRRDYNRIFGVIDTGTLTSFGTRAFLSASYSRSNNPFNNYGVTNKHQYNARIYQPLWADGDFVSISGNYNENRNNFFGSVSLRNDANRVVPNRFPNNREERFYNINYPCTVDTPQAGVADSPNTCGSEFDRRYNPSNTGNIRGQSRFTLTDSLALTVDPSYQYVKANGGGVVNAREQCGTLSGNRAPGQTFCGVLNTGVNTGSGSVSGFGTYVGVDLNGDGDLLDQVRILNPSQTQTHRYGVIANLIWDISESHRLRATYTWDRARHRQTGEHTFLTASGEPIDVFAINQPIEDATGTVLQKRDRLSYAILHQVSAEYRGEFMDDNLIVVLGLRAPFFERQLNQYCFTIQANGNVACLGQNQAREAAFAAANPYTYNPTTNIVTGFAPPQSRTYNYDDILPNVGITYSFTPAISAFVSYARGISVPGTDPLYASLYFPDIEEAQPAPETTDSIDVGLRYQSRLVQAQLTGWYTKYENRLATAYDPELDQTTFRNLGQVTKWGIDASIAYRVVPQLLFYVWGSYLNSEIEENLQTGQNTFLATAGRREAGAPEYTLGARVQGSFGPLEIGAQAKLTGPRYVNDENLPVFQTISGVATQVYDAQTPEYTLVDLDIRYSLADAGLERTYIQLNVQNLFDEVYVGGFGGVADRNSVPFVQIGPPRSVILSLVVGF